MFRMISVENTSEEQSILWACECELPATLGMLDPECSFSRFALVFLVK